MAREQRYLQCLHCGYLNPVTGEGGRIVAKVQKAATPPKPPPDPDHPKITLRGILGTHLDDYTALSNLFGRDKNFAPLRSATAYAAHLTAGIEPEVILRATTVYTKLTEHKYLKQLASWLEGQDFTLPEPPRADPTDRMAARRRAE